MFNDPNKMYYIVVDPMGDKHRQLEFNFDEYNAMISPNRIVYINESKTFKIINPEGQMLKQLDL